MIDFMYLGNDYYYFGLLICWFWFACCLWLAGMWVVFLLTTSLLLFLIDLIDVGLDLCVVGFYEVFCFLGLLGDLVGFVLCLCVFVYLSILFFWLLL